MLIFRLVLLTTHGWKASSATSSWIWIFITSKCWPNRVNTPVRVSQIIVHIIIIYSVRQFPNAFAITPQISQIFLPQCFKPCWRFTWQIRLLTSEFINVICNFPQNEY